MQILISQMFSFVALFLDKERFFYRFYISVFPISINQFAALDESEASKGDAQQNNTSFNFLSLLPSHLHCILCARTLCILTFKERHIHFAKAVSEIDPYHLRII